MSHYPKTELNTVKRLSKRANYDHAVIFPIIDATPICTVAFAVGSQPFIVPTIHARVDETIYLHGARGMRMVEHAIAGNPFCLNFTLLDGLVLARSAFHSSMNYRSVVVYGAGRLVETREEKLIAFEAVTEHVMAGRWQDARPITDVEINATAVVAIDIESASAKVRTGDPIDDEEDYALPIWAGVVPVQQQLLTPINDPRLIAGVELPDYIRKTVTSNE
ncbi:MAG: pyridoxamine 5'-phosphate oxidase family protein [Phototrophicaceae bacterium]|jgi:nitroimidazol reductase NimA-like FMN-containing flavoprotein (pyridoxamine 5'-phosphate oxidase superfamily)